MHPQWRQQQLDALKAMGIPLYQQRPQEAADSRQSQHLYRLGPLCFSTGQPLPVELPQWLQDLCCIVDARPVAVNAVNSETVLSIEECQQTLQTAQGKRQLWQQLMPLLGLQ